MKAHVRIEKPAPREAGAFHVVTNDRIIAVGADGSETDISHAVTAWHEHSEVGEPRRLEMTFLGFDVREVEEEANDEAS